MSSTAAGQQEHSSLQQLSDARRRQIEQDVARTAAAGRESVEHRLSALEHEWDAERVLLAVAGGASLAGVVMELVSGHSRWRLLPLAAGVLLLQQAVQDTSPALDSLRRLGLRTRSEIDFEEAALCAAIGEASRFSKHDYVETASGHIKRATQA